MARYVSVVELKHQINSNHNGQWL